MRCGAACEPCLEEQWVLHEAFPDVTQWHEQTDHPFQLEVRLSAQCLVFDLTERLHQKDILMNTEVPMDPFIGVSPPPCPTTPIPTPLTDDESENERSSWVCPE